MRIMTEIKELEPKTVWGFFEEITRIPRPSKREGKMIAWLEAFAREHGLECRKDAAGNVVIVKPATSGRELSPTVVLQSHMDMVCEKNGDVEFDFDRDPIRAYVDGEWVKARGTTLGADCGIGMAAALALLVSQDIPHGKIEALFTVDEETGLTGAFGLGEGMLTGKYLINLDSEDEGEIFIGCAGGIDTVAVFTYHMEPCPERYAGFRISVKGLTGGHSGDDIDKGHANSNKLLDRFLWNGARKFGLRMARFDGGNLRNAIPREAEALFAVPADREEALKDYFRDFSRMILEEYEHTERKAEFGLEPSAVKEVLDRESQDALLNCLYAVPNGVLAMSRTMEGLVETSSNLASVKFGEGNRIVVTTSQRSSLESAKYDAMAAVESAFLLGGARVTHSEGYPGWTPDPSSELLKIVRETYEELFGTEPKVRAIHAGLECGLFLQKYPQLEMVSFGPTLRGVHSPDERLEIASVEKFWKLLVGTVERIVG